MEAASREGTADRDVQMRHCGQTSKSLGVWARVPRRSWDSSASPQTQSMRDPQLLLHWAAGILLSSSELRCKEDTWGLVQPSREKSGVLHAPHFQAFASLPHGHQSLRKTEGGVGGQRHTCLLVPRAPKLSRHRDDSASKASGDGFGVQEKQPGDPTKGLKLHLSADPVPPFGEKAVLPGLLP